MKKNFSEEVNIYAVYIFERFGLANSVKLRVANGIKLLILFQRMECENTKMVTQPDPRQ